ncbi:MAG: hypothetical protein LBM38_01045 [Clostridiales bacterium]|jgi:hypothetical protein|nr:hypothetical protein [Clostridiales bacterium]
MGNINEQLNIAFIFDSGKFNTGWYGEEVFEVIMSVEELKNCSDEIVIRAGDILDRRVFGDLSPFLIKDDLCTIDFQPISWGGLKGWPFCWVLQNISEKAAKVIDDILNKKLVAYKGMARVDMLSKDERKQFWKNLIPLCSVKENLITAFHNECDGEEENFVFEEATKKLSYAISIGSYTHEENEHFDEKIEVDLDRDLSEMNFALRKELQISGAMIWKSIEEISKIKFFHPDDKSLFQNKEYLCEYPFLALYFAAQGVERLQKIIIELMYYKNKDLRSEQDRIRRLLMSHNHTGLRDYINKIAENDFKDNENILFDVLLQFYNDARYSRFSTQDDINKELKLLEKIGGGNKEEYSENIKKAFGTALGKIAFSYYNLVYSLCSELNIYAYELESESTACLVFRGEKSKKLYNIFLQIKQSKKELIFWLLKYGQKHPEHEFLNVFQELDFDRANIGTYISEIFDNKNGCEYLSDAVDVLYDELCEENKQKWKERLEGVDYLIGNSNIIFDEVDDDEES